MKRSIASLAVLLAGARGRLGGDVSESSAGGAPAARRPVQAGVWGGEHVGMEVAGGGATTEFDCGRAVISRPLRLDRRGREPSLVKCR